MMLRAHKEFQPQTLRNLIQMAHIPYIFYLLPEIPEMVLDTGKRNDF